MFTKLVTAEAAAIAMGGFSYPRLDSTQEWVAKSLENTLQYFAEYGRWDAPIDEKVAFYKKAKETVQTYKRETAPVRFWYGAHSLGSRELDAYERSVPVVINDDMVDDQSWYWLGYDPIDVLWARYGSATSGSGLVYKSHDDGFGELTFLPSRKDPNYRGAYYAAWKEARDVNISGSVLMYSTVSSS